MGSFTFTTGGGTFTQLTRSTTPYGYESRQDASTSSSRSAEHDKKAFDHNYDAYASPATISFSNV